MVNPRDLAGKAEEEEEVAYERLKHWYCRGYPARQKLRLVQGLVGSVSV